MAKFVKKQNLSIIIETYTDNEGNEKKKWRTIGSLVTMEKDDGSQYQFGEIFYPKAKFSVYDIKPREGSVTKKATVPVIQQDDPGPIEKKEEEINIKDIPF